MPLHITALLINLYLLVNQELLLFWLVSGCACCLCRQEQFLVICPWKADPSKLSCSIIWIFLRKVLLVYDHLTVNSTESCEAFRWCFFEWGYLQNLDLASGTILMPHSVKESISSLQLPVWISWLNWRELTLYSCEGFLMQPIWVYSKIFPKVSSCSCFSSISLFHM